MAFPVRGARGSGGWLSDHLRLRRSLKPGQVRPILFPCGGRQAKPGDGVWNDPKSVARYLASVLDAMKQLIAPRSILNATTFSRGGQERVPQIDRIFLKGSAFQTFAYRFQVWMR